MTQVEIIRDEIPPAAMTSDELRTALRSALGVTVAAVRRVAMIWAELESRGEDMSEFRFALSSYMRPVASGRLLPEAVAMLAGQPRKLDRIAALDLYEQRRLVDGGTVAVATADGAVVEKTLGRLTLAETIRVLDGGIVRSPDEQRLAMRRSRAPRPKPGRRPRIVIDKGRGEARIGGVTVRLEDLVAALRTADLDHEPR